MAMVATKASMPAHFTQFAHFWINRRLGAVSTRQYGAVQRNNKDASKVLFRKPIDDVTY